MIFHMEVDLISNPGHKIDLVSSKDLLFINFKDILFICLYYWLFLQSTISWKNHGTALVRIGFCLLCIFQRDPILQMCKTYDNHFSDMNSHQCGLSYVCSSYQLVRKTLDTTYKVVVSHLFVLFLNVF